MITSRRDYLLRLIDEVARLLARVVFKRRAGAPEEALSYLVQGCERLFDLEADKLFQLTPEQHFAMLADAESPELGRDKVLLYAAFNAEAGHLYRTLGRPAIARASFLNALRLTLRAHLEFPIGNLPAYAPDLAALRETLAEAPLDATTLEWLAAVETRARDCPHSANSPWAGSGGPGTPRKTP